MYCEPAKLDYDLSTFLGFEYPEQSSCIIHQVDEDKDLHDEMGGFPKTYKFDNTIIRQKWWTEEEHDFETEGQLNCEAELIPAEITFTGRFKVLFVKDKKVISFISSRYVKLL